MSNATRLRAAGLAAILALMLAEAASAAVKPGVEYPAGTQVDTPGTGASFVIPEGWSGILPQGGTYFVLGSPAQKSYIFVLVQQMTMADAERNMTTPLSIGHGFTLVPTGDLQREGQVLSGRYSVEGGKEPMAGYIETLVDKGGLGVGYVAVSAPETASGVQKVVHQLVEETTLDQP
jgi:hypothetical protein